MTGKSKAEPKPEQVARANRLRETIADIKRGIKPSAKTPRDFTEQAAAEAARKVKSGSR
jgi:hypothetical protein